MLSITLATAGAAALINLWLGYRIIRIRLANKVLYGDGGNALLGQRMRAQLNFAEYTPIVLVLIAAIELSEGSSTLLAVAGGVYIAGRIAHAIGMDGVLPARQIGTVITLTLTGLLGLYALSIALLDRPATELAPPTPAIRQG
ncbi:MAPEG family protein [Sphingomonas baiyangensis]|uniref:MAPEG family protein n=1 Tax=Sphingomonas baiyangensis TaxID=2572576 RepID=A0A4V5PU38_9SPHN|nr:MAPEG family protein [Sphingomonas baiyangensis]TKD51898.1 MAPEG family protein [Sphingomonas baiyangensis]